MTINVRDVRIKISPELIKKYKGAAGIDRTWVPYDPANNIYDVRLTASDQYPHPDERHVNEDLEKELEKLKIVGDRIRDSPLYVKTFDKQKVSMQFFHNMSDEILDPIDNVRSKARQVHDSTNPDWQAYKDSS